MVHDSAETLIKHHTHEMSSVINTSDTKSVIKVWPWSGPRAKTEGLLAMLALEECFGNLASINLGAAEAKIFWLLVPSMGQISKILNTTLPIMQLDSKFC